MLVQLSRKLCRPQRSDATSRILNAPIAAAQLHSSLRRNGDDVRPDRVRPKSVLGSGLFLEKSSLGRANRALRLGQQQSRNVHARPSVAAKAALCPSRCKIRHLRVGRAVFRATLLLTNPVSTDIPQLL